MALKKEHKKFKKENKSLRETVANLTGSSSRSTRSRRGGGGEASGNDEAAQRVQELQRENERLRDAADAASAQLDEVIAQAAKGDAAIEAAEKENAQLKDKLLRADVSISEVRGCLPGTAMCQKNCRSIERQPLHHRFFHQFVRCSQAYKEKEAQFLKEIKYLENENLELMEEVAALRESAIQRDESVTLNIPSLTKFLADSPVAEKAAAAPTAKVRVRIVC